MDRLLKRVEVQELVALRQTALYKAVSDGRLPAPVVLGPRCIRWRASEIDEYLKGLPKRGESERCADAA